MINGQWLYGCHSHYCSNLLSVVTNLTAYPLVLTHRRSIANQGGCFQLRPIVFGFVCQHDNFQTQYDETWRLEALYKNFARV